MHDNFSQGTKTGVAGQTASPGTAPQSLPPTQSSQIRRGAGGSGQPRQPIGSTITPNYGKRNVKSYPLTESELNEIGSLRTQTTVLFSIGTGCCSFSWSLVQDIFKSTKWDSLTWEIFPLLAYVLFAVGLLLCLFGFVSFRSSKTKVDNIKKETNFG